MLAGWSAFRSREAWVWWPLLGAYVCLFLGFVFWTLYLVIFGWYPDGFSVSDVSNVGFFCFLIVVALGRMRELPQQAKQHTGVRRAAWAAAGLVMAAILACYVLAGGLLLNLLYGVPLSFLAYYTAILLACDSPGFRRYHGMIALFLFVDLLLFLMSAMILYTVYFVFDFMLAVVLALIVPAARRGARL